MLKDIINEIEWALIKSPSVAAKIVAFVFAAAIVGGIAAAVYWATGFASSVITEPFIRGILTAAPVLLFIGWYGYKQLK